MLLYKISFVLWLCLLSAFFTVYPKFCLYFIQHENALHFYQFANCYLNQVNYVQRPLWRNIVFNIVRSFTPWVVQFQFFGVVYTEEQIIINVIELIVLTIIVQYLIPKQWIDDNKMLNSFIMASIVITFGFMWLNQLYTFEVTYKGQLLKQAGHANFFFWCILAGDVSEDFFFRDMGCFGGVWHNWGWFWPYIAIWVSSYGLNAYTLGAEGFIRHPKGVIEALNLGLNPFVGYWIDFDTPLMKQEDYIITIVTCVAMITHQCYYQWKGVKFHHERKLKKSQQKSKNHVKVSSAESKKNK